MPSIASRLSPRLTTPWRGAQPSATVQASGSALGSGGLWDYRTDHAWGYEIVARVAHEAYERAGIEVDDAKDEVVGMICLARDSERTILVVSEKGYGKRTALFADLTVRLLQRAEQLNQFLPMRIELRITERPRPMNEAATKASSNP